MELLSVLRFSGDIAGHKDLSAAAFFGDGDFLALGADEGTAIQILRRAGNGHYAVMGPRQGQDDPSRSLAELVSREEASR